MALKVKKVTLTTTPQSLAALLGRELRHTSKIGLQAPEANSNNILFGDSKEQPFELRPEANALLPVATFGEIFVKAESGTEDLSIMLFDQ